MGINLGDLANLAGNAGALGNLANLAGGAGNLGDLANLAGSVLNGGGLDVGKLAQAISAAKAPDEPTLGALTAALAAVTKNEQAPAQTRKEVGGVLRQTEGKAKEGIWAVLQPFLGNADTLTKLLPFLAQAAQSVPGAADLLAKLLKR